MEVIFHIKNFRENILYCLVLHMYAYVKIIKSGEITEL